MKRYCGTDQALCYDTVSQHEAFSVFFSFVIFPEEKNIEMSGKPFMIRRFARDLFGDKVVM